MSEASPPARRGSALLFAAGFVAVLAAGVMFGLAARELLREVGLLWASIASSAVAVVLAVAAVLVPGRPGPPVSRSRAAREPLPSRS